jgi:hypothetical protein
VELRAERMTSDELRTTWEQYSRLCDQAEQSMTVLYQAWVNAADIAAKDQSEQELVAVLPEYEVLMAWTAVFKAAYVFSRYGCESQFLPDECVTKVITRPVM